jgi:hypothetical protein
MFPGHKILFLTVLPEFFERELSCHMRKNEARLSTMYVQNVSVGCWGVGKTNKRRGRKLKMFRLPAQ